MASHIRLYIALRLAHILLPLCMYLEVEMSKNSVALAAAAAILSLASAPQIVNSRSLAKAIEVQENEKDTQTFTGTIVKSADHYSLNDTMNKVTYELDAPQKASVFLGKKVKVVGALDAEKKSIHVEAIAEIA
jgi:Protein of unknown function (DUF5818)